MKILTRTVAALVVVALAAPAAAASPVAQTKDERELYGRTFLEPLASYNYIQFGEGGHGEFEGGMKLLEKLFPRYLNFTTVAEQLGNKHAVSVGEDGYPSWDPKDTGDGLPIHAAIVTDTRVPDRNKEYVVLMASHQMEPCGREAMWRFLEDLLMAATEDPDRKFDNATGVTDKTMSLTARQILARTKIYFIATSPDGWRAGDGTPGLGGHSQDNGAAINSNRVAYQDGWSFPPDPVLYRQGYTTLTQPEGAGTTEWLKEVKRKELGGRPFAIGMDVHGPVPAGFILLHDQGNDPEKLFRAQDLGLRIRRNMEETMPPASVLDALLDTAAEQARRNVPDVDGTTADQTAWRSSGLARWAFVTHIADALTYTAANTWGGWMNSHSGLDAVSLSYEINCRASSPWNGVDYQKWVDNMRAVFETGVVSAASMAKLEPRRIKLDGKVGFYDSGIRITETDGNPVPPPANFPDHPIIRQIKQGHYNVSNVDYFRDLRGSVTSPPVEVRHGELGTLQRLDTFVVADTTIDDAAALKAFARAGGNLVLTDAALQLVPKLTKVSPAAVDKYWGYVGYSDLKRTHRFTHDLLTTARQTYDPTGLGYPLFMERDSYWTEDGQGGSSTQNSAPIWVVARDVWESAGGQTIGTVDPPARRGLAEGTAENLTTIGTLPLGKGRIVIFGALLPQPTENFSHWFGLNAYTISAAGQTMLLRALDWKRK